MYTPPFNREEDIALLHGMMQANSFATLVTSDGGAPVATHLPVLLRPQEGKWGMLVAHLARANNQWRHFQPEREVLVIFQDAHAYVSPTFYTPGFSVPTWNYSAVHAYGIPQIVEEPGAVMGMLDELVAVYEQPRPAPYAADWSDERVVKLTRGIVAFTIEITRLEGKRKLSQNRSLADRQGVIDALQYGNPDERKVAAAMAADLAQLQEAL
ncbi:MAG: FMN-binding negative transcriptional regulator [Chloroflexi bacterium]|nr:MAG: FMN-binding negative transcriptional regulator [Chloroflexota bacterium]